MKVTDNKDGSRSTTFKLAQGSAMQRNDYTSLTWDTGTGWQEGMPTDPKEKIRKAMSFYSTEPIVNKSVKLLAQLSNDTFKISAEDKKIELFFNSWWKDIGGSEFISWFFLEYYRSGNVITFKTLMPYVPSTKKDNTRASEVSDRSLKALEAYNGTYEKYVNTHYSWTKNKATKKQLTEAEKDFATAADKWKVNSVPGAYTVLNPLAVNINGPSDFPWMQGITMKVNADTKKAFQDPAKEMKEMLKTIPKEVVKEVLAGSDSITLPAYLCSTVFRDKQPYERWAEPLCAHAFEALETRKEMRDMDKHTVRGVRNRILKVTVGSDKFPVLDNKELSNLATMFNNPSRNLTIFWNHTLKIEFIEPDLTSLNMDKYEPTTNEIRTTFGIAPVLTGGSDSTLGNSIINIKGLVELVSESQEAFIVWFRKEAKMICESMGLKEVPEGNFNKLNFKDENDFVRVILQMVDRQVVSYETACETIGYYFPKELERLRNEAAIREKEGILVAQKAPTQGGGESGSSDPSGQSGRPPGTAEPGGRKSSQNKTKTPSGKKAGAVASASDDQSREIASIIQGGMDRHAKDKSPYAKFYKSVSSLIADKFGDSVSESDVVDILKDEGCNPTSQAKAFDAVVRIFEHVNENGE
jgi:hypothetical protein